MRTGAIQRKDARQSLRRRKKVSQPGQTPSVRSKHKFATLKNILFAVNMQDKTVTTGIVLYNKSKVQSTKTLPQLMEEGGSAKVKVRGKMITAKYPKRPTMGPSLDRIVKAGTLPKSLQGQFY